MTTDIAAVHLQHASDFITGVERETNELRRQVIEHEASVGDLGFLKGMTEANRLAAEKSRLIKDLELASQELKAAEKLDPEGATAITSMRASILRLNGQIEMVWGTLKQAQELYSLSLQIAEVPMTHFLLGVCYECQYKPKDALLHFEKCLELDPAGEYSVAAIREADAMKNYKKRFRGSWGTLCILILIWPAAIWYFYRNWK